MKIHLVHIFLVKYTVEEKVTYLFTDLLKLLEECWAGVVVSPC